MSRSAIRAAELQAQAELRAQRLKVRDEKILRGHRLGLSVAQITKAAGCNWAVAREVLEQHGLTPRLDQPNLGKGKREVRP
jgi:hypothetical protein